MQVRATDLMIGDKIGCDTVEYVWHATYPMNTRYVRVIIKRNGRLTLEHLRNDHVIGVIRNERS